MAKFIFNLPDIGEGIAEAEIVSFHVKPGDRISEDQPIADIMTDKATVEMESPVSGVVLRIAGEPGDVIAIGSMLVEIETEGEDLGGGEIEAVSGPEKSDVMPPTVETQADAMQDRLLVNLPSQNTDKMIKISEIEVDPSLRRHDVTASPAVRARAKSLGVALSDVMTSTGHVRHSDLDAYLSYGAGQGYHAPQAVYKRADEAIKVIGLRRRIAENMAASKRHIPHFTYVEEIDVTAIEAVRADLNANRSARPKLTLLPLLIVAICRSIPEFPMMNARYDDEGGVVTRYGSVHLGMATQTEAGLMVPVIREAQDLNIWQLATEIGRLAQAARDGSATIEELSGSTLTITSLGSLGGIATTPVINRPEVAIIGPNKIVERPVFVGDTIESRKLMNLSISCDHRVVDGWDAASFVQALKKRIETPILLFAD